MNSKYKIFVKILAVLNVKKTKAVIFNCLILTSDQVVLRGVVEIVVASQANVPVEHRFGNLNLSNFLFLYIFNFILFFRWTRVRLI